MRRLAPLALLFAIGCATSPQPTTTTTTTTPTTTPAKTTTTQAPVTTAPAASALPGSGDAALRPLLRDYVIAFLRFNPAVATYLGGAALDPSLKDVDGKLRDHSQKALESEDFWMTMMQRRINEIAPATLSPTARIDREVALAQIAFILRQHRIRLYQTRALDTYTDEPFRAVDFQLQGMTQTGPNSYGTPDEWKLLAERLRTIPWYLRNAADQLKTGISYENTPDYRMLYRHGVTAADRAGTYFADTLPQIARERIAGPRRDELLADIDAETKKAAAAFRWFRDSIAITFFDDARNENGIKPRYAGDRFAMGEQEYNWALKNNLRINKTAAQLFDESWPVVQQTQREMVTLAREIGTKNNWTLPADDMAAVRFVFDQLGKDSPKSDEEMVSWYRDVSFRLVDYGRRTKLFDIPADYKLEVVQTPPPLRSSIDGAAYYPAPPFKTTGVGRFYVTPTDNDRVLLREHNRSAVADLAAHEGFPGHDWYYKVLAEAKESISPVRWLTPGSVEDSSSMWEDSMSSEGWGLYAEALMAEPQADAPNGFYTPEERLYQLQGKLYRDLRVRVDTGIHTGRMTYNDAVDLFSQVVDFLPGSCRDAAALKDESKRGSCTTSERAIFRYSKWPTQAITYRLGKEEIFALRDEAKRRLGNKFDLRQFHLQFIRQGTIPSGYFREELLKDLAK